MILRFFQPYGYSKLRGSLLKSVTLIHIISTVFIVWFITFFFYVWDYERYVMIFNFINIFDVIVYQFIWNIATNVTY